MGDDGITHYVGDACRGGHKAEGFPPDKVESLSWDEALGKLRKAEAEVARLKEDLKYKDAAVLSLNDEVQKARPHIESLEKALHHALPLLIKARDGGNWTRGEAEDVYRLCSAALTPKHVHSALCIGGIDWPDCLASEPTGESCGPCMGTGQVCFFCRRPHCGMHAEDMVVSCPSCQKKDE